MNESTNPPPRRPGRAGLRSADPEVVLRALGDPRSVGALHDLATLAQRSRARSMDPDIGRTDHHEWALVAVAALAVLLTETRRVLADATVHAAQLGVGGREIDAARRRADDVLGGSGATS